MYSFIELVFGDNATDNC